MKISANEQEQLVKLLTQLYHDILPIERDHKLLVGGSDYRPRIDYFHDAIRAFTSGDMRHFDKGGRLSIEFLAYDLAMLRYIEAKPLASIRPIGGATVTDVMIRDAKLPTGAPVHIARELRDRMSESYESYGVLYAALFKPFADRNYQTRNEEVHTQLDEVRNVKHLLETKKKPPDVKALADHANYVEDDSLRQAIKNVVESGGNKGVEELETQLKAVLERMGKDAATLDKAHLDYVMAQLGLFEQGKDLLKKLAQRGMNVVGKFVENSMAEAKQEQGRGR